MVCIGNICRSPLAEQLLTARLAEAGLADEFIVSSAGLSAVVGAPMDTIPAEISTGLGGAPANHRGRQLNTTMSSDADLILTMTRAQRDEVVRRYPRTLQRTFSLTEFVTLLAQADASPAVTDSEALYSGAAAGGAPRTFAVEAWRGRVRTLARKRGQARLTALDDIRDPYLQSRQLHEDVGQQISLAISHIAHSFAS
jgi:protein-tyrosine phosphatase